MCVWEREKKGKKGEKYRIGNIHNNIKYQIYQIWDKLVKYKVLHVSGIKPGTCKASNPGRSVNFNPPTFFLQ